MRFYIFIILYCSKTYAFLYSTKVLTDVRRRQNALLASYGEDDDKPALSIGQVLLVSVGVVGVFGTGFIGTFRDALGGLKEDTNAPVIKNDGEKNRGAKTRLTRKEINGKLSQVPIFYVTKANSDAIIIGNNVGSFFVENDDAAKFAKFQGDNYVVRATSLDDCFFTLIQKKTKLGGFIEGVASSADPQAEYILVPSPKQLQNVPADWKVTHGSNDVPLFRVTTLAFNKENGLEFPLFTQKEDAISSWTRLQESQGKSNAAPSPEVQVSSVLDLVNLFSAGGFEGRALEIYPSMDAIETARSIIQAN